MTRNYVLSFSSIATFAGLVASLAHCTAADPEQAGQAFETVITTKLNPQCASLSAPNACAGQQSPMFGIGCCTEKVVGTQPGTCAAEYPFDIKSAVAASACSVSNANTAGMDHCSLSSGSTATSKPYDCTTPDLSSATFPLVDKVTATCPGVPVHDTCHESITVLDCEAPALHCPSNPTLACGVKVRDIPGLDAGDNCSLKSFTCVPPLDAVLDASADIVCTTTDSFANATTCTFHVTVGGGAPVLTPSAQPIELWPPNHKYREISLLAGSSGAPHCLDAITDSCGQPIHHAALAIAYVTSDEVEDGDESSLKSVGQNGDGHTCDDIVIPPSSGGNASVMLRSERDGTRDGRVYTIHYTVTANGATTPGTCAVLVPHDQSPPPVPFTLPDDGCHYCVAGAGQNAAALCGSCPQHDPMCDY